ncbi:hypothetical protein LTR66_009020 [Elasticomyces elasticus]|nr:hypothetical protein LTR66_009020 [Elasticomyces elasticus]
MTYQRRFALLLILTITAIAGFLFHGKSLQTTWRHIPQAIGLGEHYPSPEEIADGSNILPDLRDSRPSPDDQHLNSKGHADFLPGTTKPAGEKYTRTVVLARSQENTTWLESELSDLFALEEWKHAVYVVDDPRAPFHPPKNKGHEVMVYLSFIIDHYEKLPDLSIFMHAHRFAWHNNELLNTDAAEMLRRLSPERVIREGYMNLRCHWDPGCPDWLHPGALGENLEKQEETLLARSWGELFPLEPIPAVLSQPCCAQFALSRERILALPKSRYVYFRDWLLRSELSDYLSGRVFEYIWHFIFTGRSIVCPAMHACYCDGYGICFGGEKEFDDWFEIRFRMRESETRLSEWMYREKMIEEAKTEGRVEEEAELVVPELGRDVELRKEIKRLQEELDRRKDRALERGQDARNRAVEAGRQWREGDGF